MAHILVTTPTEPVIVWLDEKNIKWTAALDHVRNLIYNCIFSIDNMKYEFTFEPIKRGTYDCTLKIHSLNTQINSFNFWDVKTSKTLRFYSSEHVIQELELLASGKIK